MKWLRNRIKKFNQRQNQQYAEFFQNLDSYEAFCKAFDFFHELPGFTEWMHSQVDAENPENYDGDYFKPEYVLEKRLLFQKEKGLPKQTIDVIFARQNEKSKITNQKT